MENIQENMASAAQNTEFSETSSETKCEILPKMNMNYQKMAPLEDEKNNGKDDKIWDSLFFSSKCLTKIWLFKIIQRFFFIEIFFQGFLTFEFHVKYQDRIHIFEFYTNISDIWHKNQKIILRVFIKKCG